MIGFLAYALERESRNISHGHPGEAKEILKDSGDDSFGNDEKLLGDGGGRSSATPVHGGTDTIHAGSQSSPLHCR